MKLRKPTSSINEKGELVCNVPQGTEDFFSHVGTMHTYNAIAIPDLIAMLECLPASEIQALNQAAHSETVPSEIPTSFESEIIM